jgi:hypothetical protein
MHLDPQEGDDRRFLDFVTRVVRSAPTDTHELIVIRVDNWFDHGGAARATCTGAWRTIRTR